jgi:N-acetylneuraminic acid mutarotase
VSSVAELPDLHLMGHTCANLNGDLIFVWGGTNDSVAFSSQPNTDLWIYETLTGYWRHRKCSGDCPPYLSSCSSALIGQKMYIFGGHCTAQDNWLNCLYCLDLDTFVWRDLGSQARAEPTKPIRSDKNVAWSYNNKMYVFGGYGWSQVEHYLELTDCQADLQLVPDIRWPKFGWNNQLVEYDPADGTWRWPSYKGKCPSARAAHSGALMGDKYFVFGGRDSHERLNDLYTFDMKSFEWQRIAVFSSTNFGLPLINDRQLTPRRQLSHLLESNETGTDHTDNAAGPVQQASVDRVGGTTSTTPSLPAGRSFCSLIPISNEHMLLFGGVDSNDRNLDDCWIFNINTNQWTQITDFKHKRSRLWHTGAKTKQNEIVIMGGSSSEKIDEYCTDVFVMSFEPKSLKRLSLDAVSRSIRMKTIQRTKDLPSTLVKLIKLRKQALSLTMRQSANQTLVLSNRGHA